MATTFEQYYSGRQDLSNPDSPQFSGFDAGLLQVPYAGIPDEHRSDYQSIWETNNPNKLWLGTEGASLLENTNPDLSYYNKTLGQNFRTMQQLIEYYNGPGSYGRDAGGVDFFAPTSGKPVLLPPDYAAGKTFGSSLDRGVLGAIVPLLVMAGGIGLGGLGGAEGGVAAAGGLPESYWSALASAGGDAGAAAGTVGTGLDAVTLGESVLPWSTNPSLAALEGGAAAGAAGGIGGMLGQIASNPIYQVGSTANTLNQLAGDGGGDMGGDFGDVGKGGGISIDDVKGIGGDTDWLDLLKRFGPSVLSLISGGVGLSQAGNLSALSREAANRADPFASRRSKYADMLDALYANPSSIVNMPGYKAGETAVTRSQAAGGYLGSGNMMAALQKYGGDFFNSEANRLATLAGAGSVGGGSNQLLAGGVASSDMLSRALASLMYGVKGMATA